tara:strand:- start:22 stop:294 length:273 start_codon:yes stop_codon:yes gene_type:complete
MRESDYRAKLIDYLKKNLKKNYTEESLKWALISQGYSRTDVMKAMEQANKELAEKVPVHKEKPVIKYQIIDEKNKPIIIKRPFWKRILGL